MALTKRQFYFSHDSYLCQCSFISIPSCSTFHPQSYLFQKFPIFKILITWFQVCSPFWILYSHNILKLWPEYDLEPELNLDMEPEPSNDLDACSVAE